MAKKKNNVSINALERYCNGEGENVLTRTIKALNGEEVTYEVKKRLSFEECARFVEDVVKECIVSSADLIVPISKQFVIRRNLMTYYANFTMPVSMVKAFDLVMASGDSFILLSDIHHLTVSTKVEAIWFIQKSYGSSGSLLSSSSAI